MFNRRLPAPLYEHLPWIYLGLAFLVALFERSAWRWVAVAALVAACALTAWSRYKYRSKRPAAVTRRQVVIGRRVPRPVARPRIGDELRPMPRVSPDQGAWRQPRF